MMPGTDYEWQVLEGVRHCVAESPNLRLVFPPRLDKPDLISAEVKHFQVDALIGFVTRAMRLWEQALDIPVVNLDTNQSGDWVSVLPDHASIGALAADHLIEVGQTRFLFVGFDAVAQQPRLSATHGRFTGFRDRLSARGFPCEVCSLRETDASGELELRSKLSSPVGVFGMDDTAAARVCEWAVSWGCRVPGDLSIVGVNNSVRLCEMAPVPLSSVDVDPQRIGWEAVRLAHAMLRGERARSSTVAPTGVVQRDSSQPTAADDPDLDFALHFIRDHACQGMRVGDMMDQIHVSRRTLETRFVKRFGRTLHDEIRRVRIQHAEALLLATDLRVGDIAYRCGYAKHSAFTEQFTKVAGMSPIAYRAARRSPSDIGRRDCSPSDV